MRSSRLSATVSQDGDVFEASLKAVDERLHNGLWDVWIDNPTFAHQLIARFKDAGATPSITYKQAAGMTTVELPVDLAAALSEARGAAGDAAITAALRQLAPGQGRIGASLSDDEKAAPRTKSTRKPAGWENDPARPMAGIAARLAPELYRED